MLLVTGGAGFIGSNLVAALAERGHDVVVCDRLGEGDKWRNLAHHTIEDVIPPEELPQFLRWAEGRLSAVFHLGAISATTETDGDALLANNFRLSKVFWDHCAREGIPLIYASSAATYGDGAEGFDDDASAEYLARLRPLNGYGWSKHLFDRWVMRRLAKDAPPDESWAPPQWAGLKFFNVYGPNEYHKGGQASVAWHLFGQLSRGEPARLFQSHHPDYADGGQLRDFIWVGDCVDVMLWLLDHPKVSGLFNVGTGKARSFADLARAVFAAMDKPENISYVPAPEAIRDKYQYFTEAKMARLRTAGYGKPFTDLEEGVARYVKDYLTQSDPYR
ncbi:ADP-glyceromanno-heptose 6-epimerase [Pelagibius sp. 7325]|uniref:ADP-glyceromanno-heptose 6-epimerase n=1 Tax=Pelagibius sp. 7325 TaxID=3131994 RepID=UPI0030EB98B4